MACRAKTSRFSNQRISKVKPSASDSSDIELVLERFLRSLHLKTYNLFGRSWVTLGASIFPHSFSYRGSYFKLGGQGSQILWIRCGGNG